MKRTTVTLSDELAAKVDSEAARTGRTRSAVICESVERQLGRGAEAPRPKHRGATRPPEVPEPRRVIPWAGIVSWEGPPYAADVDSYLEEHWAADITRGYGTAGGDSESG